MRVCMSVNVMHSYLVGEARQSYRNRYKRADSVVGIKKKKNLFTILFRSTAIGAVSVAMVTDRLSIVNIDLRSKQEFLGD